MQSTIYLFETAAAGDQPLVLFAYDEAPAKHLAQAWLNTHSAPSSALKMQLEPADDAWIQKHPALLEVALEGFVGTATWINAKDGWMVCDPPVSAQAPGSNRRVRCFQIEPDDMGEVLVFSHSMEEAVDMFLSWHVDAFSTEPTRFEVCEIERGDLFAFSMHLVREFDAGLTGIAGRSINADYHIYPPDHHMAGE